MKIARPSNGFNIHVSPNVKAFVDQMCKDDKEFFWRWESVLARLRGTGHVAGDAVTENPGHRAAVFVVDQWRIKVVWLVVGDTVTIKLADF